MHRRVGHSNYDGKIAGLYDMEETLGRGHFAVVKLARHVFTGEKVAVKVIDKSKLDEVSRSHLFQEVRCMKLVQHPNVVRLYEVIDTQTKLYLILELGDGGDLYDYIMRHESGLSEEVARTYFRQIVRAISYCHRLHVVHRDLKPENVVFFEKLGMVKLTDFGFSNRFCPGQKLETSCGSLAYSAPEILLGDSYDAPAVDVWSLGVILYMLVCGQAPFQEANDSETLTMIMDCKYSIPTHVSDGCKQLIARMLVRQPERRASLEEIASNSWLVSGSDSDPAESLPLVSRQQVSEEHHNLIITKMVNGNIATKEDILEALDKNEYNHITATYFLLAERKLRAHRQEEIQKNGSQVLVNISSSKPNNLAPNNTDADQNTLSNLNPTIRSIPRTAGDVPQNFRVRKCSIVQEEDDEDEMSSCSGRDDHGSNSTQSSVSRRGSRSEGKLSHVIQEKLSQNTGEKHSIHNSHLNAHAVAHANAHSHAHDIPLTISLCNKTVTTSIGGLSEEDNNGKLKISDSNKSEYDKSTAHKLLNDSQRTSESVENISQTMKANLLSFKDDKFTKNNIDNSDLEVVTSEAWIKKPGNIDIGRQKSVHDYLKSSSCNKWRMGSKHQHQNQNQNPLPPSHDNKIVEGVAVVPEATTVTTTILNASSTVSIPLNASLAASGNQLLLPNYKSLPTANTQGIAIPEESLSLDEILEDRTNDGGKNRIVRRTSYEQRRSKFHKTRTASCSSSDASDDDSEGRKKRANKLGTSGKPLQQRRDSHDDSSDSQDPGGNCGGGGGGGGGHSGALSDNKECTTTTNSSNNRTENGKTNSGGNDTTNNGGGGKRCSINQATSNNVFERRHRTGRRRSGETRLRESQSLNRITEVQEAEGPCHNNNNFNSNSNSNILIVNNQSINTSNSTSISNTVTTFSSTTNNVKQKAKGFGARLLHSWSLTTSSINTTSSSSCSSSSSSSNNSSRKSSIIYEEKEKEKEKEKISCVKVKEYLKEDDNHPHYHNHEDAKSQSCKNDERIVVVGGDNSKIGKCIVKNESDGCKVKISENRLNNKIPVEITKKKDDDVDGDNGKDKNRSTVVVNKVNSNSNSNSNSNCKNKKFHLLSRYFAIHKKLCIPLPSMFGGKGRLYKAQSCGSITRDRVNVSVSLASSVVASPKSVLLYSGDDMMWGEKKHHCNHHHHHHNQRYRGSDGDINQNLDLSHLVNNVRKEFSSPIPNTNVTTACHIHFGDTSKCCSLC